MFRLITQLGSGLLFEAAKIHFFVINRFPAFASSKNSIGIPVAPGMPMSILVYDLRLTVYGLPLTVHKSQITDH